MKGYHLGIHEATGCPPEDCEAIEEMMREDRPTLDGLYPDQFRKLARDSVLPAALMQAALVFRGDGSVSVKPNGAGRLSAWMSNEVLEFTAEFDRDEGRQALIEFLRTCNVPMEVELPPRQIAL